MALQASNGLQVESPCATANPLEPHGKDVTASDGQIIAGSERRLQREAHRQVFLSPGLAKPKMPCKLEEPRTKRDPGLLKHTPSLYPFHAEQLELKPTFPSG